MSFSLRSNHGTISFRRSTTSFIEVEISSEIGCKDAKMFTRMKFLDVQIIVLTVILCILSDSCTEKRMTTENSIRIEQIHHMFARLEAQSVDLAKPHLYGYFFFDKERHGLERLSNDMARNGYTLVNLEQIDDGRFRLHVEKIETHSPESLYERGQALSEIASKYSVDVYDGFDVGNSEPSKALVSEESFLAFMNSKPKEELFAFGEKLLDLELHDRAEQVFRECLNQKISPQDSTHNLSLALLEQKKTDEAVSLLEAAVKEFPSHLKMRFNLGATHYDLGNFQKTLENYQVASRLSPNDGEIMYGIAAAQYGLGQFSESLINCNKALALNPENENAKGLLRLLEERK